MRLGLSASKPRLVRLEACASLCLPASPSLNKPREACLKPRHCLRLRLRLGISDIYLGHCLGKPRLRLGLRLRL